MPAHAESRPRWHRIEHADERARRHALDIGEGHQEETVAREAHDFGFDRVTARLLDLAHRAEWPLQSYRFEYEPRHAREAPVRRAQLRVRCARGRFGQDAAALLAQVRHA